MLDLIDGLPLHPLVVHAVVVLLPLSALGAIAIAVRPTWRRAYGGAVVGATALATGLIPLATQSGEALGQRVGTPGRHSELGDQLVWCALPLLVAVLALVWWDRRTAGHPGAPDLVAEAQPASSAAVESGRAGSAGVALAVVTVLLALACLVQVYRVGESGARAVWGPQVSAAATTCVASTWTWAKCSADSKDSA